MMIIVRVRGAGRYPTAGKNQPSAYLHGHLLSDALGSWVKQGLMAGPYRREDLPWPEVKISPMGIQLKPNGSGRLIVDMSHPHLPGKPVVFGDVPISCNASIDKSAFPAEMSSTKDIILALLRHGPGVTFCKQDWADAYKHVHVRQEDIRLQVVEWGGMFFIDRSLTFGMSSSPGIYHLVSSVVKRVALSLENLPLRNTYQVLDDCGYIGQRHHTVGFYGSYNKVGDRCGVKYAPKGDKEKSFEVDTEGTILGVHYDSLDWTWGFCPRKRQKILAALFDVVESDQVEQRHLESLSGRIGHYKDIICPGAKWERAFILYAACNTRKQLPGRVRRGPLMIKVTKDLRDQAWWWIHAVTASAKERSSIPDCRNWFPADSVTLYPDAAGGSDTSPGNGFGGVLWEVEGRPMVYGAWPSIIQTNRKDSSGNKFARKLTMLEGVAALATLCARPDVVRNSAVRIMTDNRGLALAYRKAHSRDKFTYSVMLALKDIAKYLNIQLAVVWTPRCSSPGELVADSLSKARFVEAAETAECQVNLCRVPRSLLKWLEAPRVTRLLGMAILEEMERDGVSVLPREPEDRSEIFSLMWSRNVEPGVWIKK